ncbi:riboflavin synthase [Oceanicella actignis]|uniref:riboflavin synthase n=1 Tax=Oceanicella actignis TaxID=1189325 RepID=UPI0011E870A5|nr:riboflavin synthase [Oceanicella actignis]TYO85012.1 riboflavin synthase alpha chain [Oceanicella actignis]
MFTGIVTDLGEIAAVERRAGDMRARILCDPRIAAADIGASIACDGVCLTVVAHGREGERGWFEADVSAETLARTNLGRWTPGRRVNLERALRVGDELGGHIVSGHVDGLARIESMTPDGDSTRVRLTAPHALARFIAPKGSVALNGVSLTVNEVEGDSFGVNIIPHTRERTTWSEARPGDEANLEIDTLARYVARLAEAG